MLQHGKSVSRVRSSSEHTLATSAVLGLAFTQIDNQRRGEVAETMTKSASASYAQTVRTVHASNQIFGLFGLDIEKYATLAAIVENSEPQTAKSLQEQLFLPAWRVKSIVSKLKARNLIERVKPGALVSTKFGVLLMASVASVLSLTLNQPGCAQ